jgi:hypothetical protein
MRSRGESFARVACAVVWLLAFPARGTASNPIAAENALPGDAGWQLTQPAPPGWLEAYAGATSVQHGQAIDFHARADGPHTFTWKLYRMGWYGGAEARLVTQGGPISVGPQPVPAPDPSTGRIECSWPVSFTIQTDPSWTSGVYLVKLQRDDGYQHWAIFTVRADERKGVAVVQSSVTTYQAYNYWGGRSLYTTPIAQEVSFDRPYVEGYGAGQYFRFEHDFVRWAESRGFDLTYLTNLDVDRDSTLLIGQKLFLSLGHDEYWSHTARASVEAALGTGVNAAFLSGNSVYWQIRLEPSRIDPSRPQRTEVCYKLQGALDPDAGTPLETVEFHSPPVNDPENALMGVGYTGAWLLVNGPYVVRNAGHWVYDGTGVADGDTIPGIAGYEVNRTQDNGSSPPGLEVLAHSPVSATTGRPEWHEAAAYTRSSGAFVFAAGTIQWTWGLSEPGVADARVQRITENLFRRAGLTPAGSSGTGTAGPPPADTTGAVGALGTLAGSAFQEGLVDGPATSARFARPTGAAVGPAGEIYVADTGNNAVRVVQNDAARTVRTIMGDGAPGGGEGGAARFRLPQAVAVAPDGSLVVADTGNARLVLLRQGPNGWTAATLAGAEGVADYVDGPAAQARFSGPAGLVFVGPDLYVADRENHVVRKLSAAGQVSTVAGKPDGTWYQDGIGTAARFQFPSDLVELDDALFVVDAGNRLVRRIGLADLAVTTAAGVPGGGFSDGPVTQARFQAQAGIAVAGGDLLVADAGNARVRRLSGGTVTSWAGSGQVGGEDGPGTTARLGAPTGLASLGSGRWLIVDQGTSVLRLAGLAPPPNDLAPPPPATKAKGGAGGGGGGCSTADGGTGALLALVLALSLRRARIQRTDVDHPPSGSLPPGTSCRNRLDSRLKNPSVWKESPSSSTS